MIYKEYVLKNSDLILEDNVYVPRFTAKKFTNPIFTKFPPNKPIKFDRDLMVQAIMYGMIIMIQYRGEKDNFSMGHSRVIAPLCLGTSTKGKLLIRGYHIRGWSVSSKGNLQKEWRMFRTDRILSMMFTGSFIRLAPDGYNEADRGMRGGIIVAGNFDNIRNNQQKLLKQNIIQNKDEISIPKGKVTTIQVEPTDTILDLANPFENKNIDKFNLGSLRITFLRQDNTSNTIAVLGALGQRDNIVKVTERGKYLGQYRVIKSTMGIGLGKPHLKNLDGYTKFNLKIFNKIV